MRQWSGLRPRSMSGGNGPTGRMSGGVLGSHRVDEPALTPPGVLQVAALMPLNTLRNAALLLADTPLVLPMDMDMLIGRELNDLAGDPERHVAKASRSRVILAHSGMAHPSP